MIATAEQTTTMPLGTALRAVAEWVDLHAAADAIHDIDIDEGRVRVHLKRAAWMKETFELAEIETRRWGRDDLLLVVERPFAEFWAVEAVP